MHLVRVEVSDRKETATSRLNVQLVQVDTLGQVQVILVQHWLFLTKMCASWLRGLEGTRVQTRSDG